MHCCLEADLYKLFGKMFGNTVKVDTHIFYDPVIPLLGIYFTEIYTYVHPNPCTIVYRSIILNYQGLETVQYPSTVDWINTLWCIYTMEC